MISSPDNLPDQRADTEDTGPESKSQRKRNAHQITELAGKLVAMKPKVLASLPLGQDIRDAITHCAEIKAHGARKRQLHFVSKLLRETDNLQELQSQILSPELTRKKKAAAPDPHLTFRDQLVDDFAGTVAALRENYPNVDLQRVRQLVRNAQAECRKARDALSPSEENADTPGANVSAKDTKAARSLLKLLTSGS